MIALLTIVIAIFIVIEVGAIMIVCDDGFTDFKNANILLKLSRILLWCELGLFLILLLLGISYMIAGSIVCNTTHNDYKGCTELRESGNNE